MKKLFLPFWWFFTGILKSIKLGFLSVFGKIRVSPYPLWINYDPRGYEIHGATIRKIIGLLQPGDILCRRYNGFLDGFFIPGRFSHSAIYIGDNMVIHAMGDGVQMIDILDFLRCDGIAILRSNKGGQEQAISLAKGYLGYCYDFDFDILEDYKNKHEVDERCNKFYCHELTRACYPDLDIPTIKPVIWHGAIRSNKRQFLAQSFFDSYDLDLIYDSDYFNPRCNIK